MPTATISGSVLLLIGPNAISADLYRLIDNPPAFARLTRSQLKLGIDGVTVDSHRIIVSSAASGLDRLVQFTGGALVPIPGLDDTERVAPQLQADGSLAYIELARRKINPTTIIFTEYIRLFDFATHQVRTLVTETTHDITGYARRPDGTLAYVQRTQDQQHGTIIVVSATGQRSSLSLKADDPTVLAYGGPDAATLAITDTKQRTVTLLTAGTVRSRLSGWLVLAWSPTGADELLVTNGHDLADWRPGASPALVGSVGDGGTLFGGTWSTSDPLQGTAP